MYFYKENVLYVIYQYIQYSAGSMQVVNSVWNISSFWCDCEVLQTSDTRVPRTQSKELVPEHSRRTQPISSTPSSQKDMFTRENDPLTIYVHSIKMTWLTKKKHY